MEITGKIEKCCDKRSGQGKASGTPWVAQEYVMLQANSNAQYPRRIVFEVFGEDRINQLNIQEGQELTVSIDIDAREYNGRWFNSIRAWRVVPAQPAVAPAPESIPSPVQPAPAPELPAEPTSDLPF